MVQIHIFPFCAERTIHNLNLWLLFTSNGLQLFLSQEGYRGNAERTTLSEIYI